MKEVCAVTFLFIIVIAYTNAQCERNEVEVNCINPCNTCEQQSVCRGDDCVEGCDCRPGYFRNQLGHCIPRRFCGGPPVDEEANDHGCPHNGHECRNWCHSQGHNHWRCNGHRCHCS